MCLLVAILTFVLGVASLKLTHTTVLKSVQFLGMLEHSLDVNVLATHECSRCQQETSKVASDLTSRCIDDNGHKWVRIAGFKF